MILIGKTIRKVRVIDNMTRYPLILVKADIPFEYEETGLFPFAWVDVSELVDDEDCRCVIPKQSCDTCRTTAKEVYGGEDEIPWRLYE